MQGREDNIQQCAVKPDLTAAPTFFFMNYLVQVEIWRRSQFIVVYSSSEKRLYYRQVETNRKNAAKKIELVKLTTII